MFLDQKGQNNVFWIALIGKGQFDNGESENRDSEILMSFIRAPKPKTLIRVQISKSLFCDFLKGKYQIDNNEFENHVPETQGFFLKAARLKASFLELKFQIHYLPISFLF